MLNRQEVSICIDGLDYHVILPKGYERDGNRITFRNDKPWIAAISPQGKRRYFRCLVTKYSRRASA